MRSARAPLVALALPAVGLALVGLHAHAKAEVRRDEQPAIDAVARLLPAADLSFAGSARRAEKRAIQRGGQAAKCCC